MRIHTLQHVPFELAGSIEEWAREKGHRLSATRLYAQEALPDMAEIDWLLVLGGPMNIYEEDRYPWLVEEKRFIQRAIESGKIVLGICLGAQLAADVLGARVVRNAYKEIGWLPVEFTEEAKSSEIFGFLPGRLTVFQWHGDTFELPPGAVRIAKSEGCLNQAFLYGERVIGLQFHLESTRESIENLIKHCPEELVEGKYIQSAEEMLADDHSIVGIHEAMYGILERISGIFHGRS